MVLPLLAEDCEVPAFLRSKRYADFRNDYQTGLAALLEVFRRRPAHNAKIDIESIDPVYWSVRGCSIKIHISCERISGGNKVIFLQRNVGEDDNVWHFQFERGLDQVNQTIVGKVWYGTRKHSDLRYQEILAAIVPKEIRYMRHPFTVTLDYDDLLNFETRTVLRDDSARRKSNHEMERAS